MTHCPREIERPREIIDGLVLSVLNGEPAVLASELFAERAMELNSLDRESQRAPTVFT